MTSTAWVEQAACQTYDRELFFDPDREDEARRICATCPVIDDCLRASMSAPFGVWGGLTEQERRERGIAPPVTHVPNHRERRASYRDVGMTRPEVLAALRLLGYDGPASRTKAQLVALYDEYTRPT